MKLPRPRNSAAIAWFAFASCACLVIGAMLWLTHNVIDTERERANAEIRAELQERVRLSLWRMDSLGTSILLEENSIPTSAFLSSPVTTLPTLAKFETPDGAAIKCEGNTDHFTQITSSLPSLISKLSKKDNTEEPPPPAPEVSWKPETKNEETSQIIYEKMRGNDEAQAKANTQEAEDRSQWVDKAIASRNKYSAPTKEIDAPPEPAAARSKKTAADAAEPKILDETAPTDLKRQEALKKSTPTALPSTDPDKIQNPIGDFKATWFNDSLFLIRRGMVMTTFAQGSLIDHDQLANLLHTEAFRLLPNAKLTRPDPECDESFVLASFPFQLHPGSIGFTAEAIPKSISTSLLAGWIAALTALLTAYFLIANMMKLSERRASFVSAVTHELRTPLTTFRLYSDMLSSGAVREEKKPTYLNVLSREADRLSHLVENVLAFSKIERGSARSNITEIEINSFLESLRERFDSRLESAGLKLELETCPNFLCRLDTSALEHILFNLIDNAAKYASSSQPPIVTITPRTKQCSVEIHIADHGPGIPKSEIRRIFKPFHKSAKQAAESKPGIGLGLSLSKRLASSMGGNLSCHPRPDKLQGAHFILKIPCKTAAA